MKIATIVLDKQEVASIITDYGYLPISLINQRYNKDWPYDLFKLLTEDLLEDIKEWYNNTDSSSHEKLGLCIPQESVKFAPLYRRPRKIWGMNIFTVLVKLTKIQA